jgi:putative ABC transport system permease protein
VRGGDRRGISVVTLANVRLALRALESTRLRTALTLLGVLIGTAAVILLVGVVTGSKSLMQRRMDALGTRAVWILPLDNPDNESGTRSRFSRLRPMDVDALRDRDRAPDIVAVEPVARVGSRVTVTWEGVSYSPADFAATPPALAPIYNVRLSSGVFYNDSDEADHAKVAVLGAEVVDHLFDDGVEPVGQKITINNVAFKVVGVMARKGTIATYNQDDIVFVPLSTGIDSITGHVDSYGVLGILAGSPNRSRPSGPRSTASCATHTAWRPPTARTTRPSPPPTLSAQPTRSRVASTSCSSPWP